jgi:crooked neck
MNDLERASQVYQACLSVIPHSTFSFSKIWIYAAKLFVRRKVLQSARKLLGRAIALCGKEKIFTEYIALELALGEVDRCRSLYTNYLKAMPHNCRAWSKYAMLEKSVGETEGSKMLVIVYRLTFRDGFHQSSRALPFIFITQRCRAIYELAVAQPALDMPEMLWKGYIDFEIEEGEGQNARELYTRLLERTGHVKVWISFAKFEATDIGNGVQAARSLFNMAYDQLKEQGLKEERVLLLEAWRGVEKEHGDAAGVAAVEAKMPLRVKRKRMRTDERGAELGWEE